MSLTLRTSKEPIWLDLTDSGVKVLVPPLDVSGMRAAEYRAYKASAAARIEMGVGDDDAPTDQQTAEIEGLFAQARIRALAERIIEWKGIVDEEGQPLPITPDALDAFAGHPQAGLAFMRAYERPVLAVAAEGNGSGRSSGGATAAGPITAPVAPESAPPVPVSSMRRKAKPAQPARLQ
jgi:hypothetical protein